jgi:hypothetical protein
MPSITENSKQRGCVTASTNFRFHPNGLIDDKIVIVMMDNFGGDDKLYLAKWMRDLN